MEGKLLKTVEVAEKLGVSTRTVLKMAADGRLAAVRLSSRAIRFKSEDVEALISGSRA